MRSLLQSQTSRLNGAKSKGPKPLPAKPSAPTPSRQTRNLNSRMIVIEGEDPARFSALLRSLRTQFQPRNIIEENLVEDLATCRWRQRRYLAMETACLSREISLQAPDSPLPSNPTRAAFAVSSLAASNSRILEHISRGEQTSNRQYNRTLKTLLALRSEIKAS